MTEISNNTNTEKEIKKEIKIEYKGSCYFFLYHNNIPKYISLPNYTIEYSEDVKIFMGNVITSKIIKNEIPKNKENK